MQLDVSSATSAALKADGTIRCLADVKYQPADASRHSSTAFAMARNLANDFTTALLAQLNQVTATHSKPPSPITSTCQTAAPETQWQLYAVQLHRNRMRVCFDVFLDRCTPEFRKRMDETVATPIHAVIKLGEDDRYQVERKPPLDARVARKIVQVQMFDEGPRPYFTDSMVVMCYDDGVRVEDNLEESFPDLAGPARFRGRRK